MQSEFENKFFLIATMIREISSFNLITVHFFECYLAKKYDHFKSQLSTNSHKTKNQGENQFNNTAGDSHNNYSGMLIENGKTPGRHPNLSVHDSDVRSFRSQSFHQEIHNLRAEDIDENQFEKLIRELEFQNTNQTEVLYEFIVLMGEKKQKPIDIVFLRDCFQSRLTSEELMVLINDLIGADRIRINKHKNQVEAFV